MEPVVFNNGFVILGSILKIKNCILCKKNYRIEHMTVSRLQLGYSVFWSHPNALKSRAAGVIPLILIMRGIACI